MHTETTSETVRKISTDEVDVSSVKLLFTSNNYEVHDSFERREAMLGCLENKAHSKSLHLRKISNISSYTMKNELSVYQGPQMELSNIEL